MTDGRVKRLKELVHQLEKLPASPDRDRVLSEARSRAVDLETGVTPRAMLPVWEPAPAPSLFTPTKRHRSSSTRTALSPRPPAVEIARPVSVVSRSPTLDQWFDADQPLSLEDAPELSPLPPAHKQEERAVPPWALGLRA
jgi:hypothetical protein